jgi:hypothetical protein
LFNTKTFVSENDRVPVLAMLFLLIPAGTRTLKNWGSGQNQVIPVHPYSLDLNC